MGAKVSRIVRTTVMVGLVVAALAPASPAVPGTSRARSAAACAPEHVAGGTYVKFRLIGHVSCDTAHRLARTYFHKVAAGQCGKLNNFCDLNIGGWSCSIFFATESQQAGGATAGCARGGAKVRFFTGSPQQQAAETAASRLGLATEHFRDCGRVTALHVGIHVYHVSCATARRIVRAYLRGGVGTGGYERVKGFPAWTCSTGDRSGGCSKGAIGSGVPEIFFDYLQAPGQQG